MAGSINPITASLLVASGGALGALARYHIGLAVMKFAGSSSDFPWGTLTVNIVGSLAMGLLIAWFTRDGGAHPLGEVRMGLLLGVGLLGGFTTFSAFSLELVLMLQRGAFGLALGYAGVSVVAGVAALYLGLSFARGAP